MARKAARRLYRIKRGACELSDVSSSSERSYDTVLYKGRKVCGDGKEFSSKEMISLQKLWTSRQRFAKKIWKIKEKDSHQTVSPLQETWVDGPKALPTEQWIDGPLANRVKDTSLFPSSDVGNTDVLNSLRERLNQMRLLSHIPEHSLKSPSSEAQNLPASSFLSKKEGNIDSCYINGNDMEEMSNNGCEDDTYLTQLSCKVPPASNANVCSHACASRNTKFIKDWISKHGDFLWGTNDTSARQTHISMSHTPSEAHEECDKEEFAKECEDEAFSESSSLSLSEEDGDAEDLMDPGCCYEEDIEKILLDGPCGSEEDILSSKSLLENLKSGKLSLQDLPPPFITSPDIRGAPKRGNIFDLDSLHISPARNVMSSVVTQNCLDLEVPFSLDRRNSSPCEHFSDSASVLSEPAFSCTSNACNSHYSPETCDISFPHSRPHLCDDVARMHNTTCCAVPSPNDSNHFFEFPSLHLNTPNRLQKHQYSLDTYSPRLSRKNDIPSYLKLNSKDYQMPCTSTRIEDASHLKSRSKNVLAKSKRNRNDQYWLHNSKRRSDSVDDSVDKTTEILFRRNVTTKDSSGISSLHSNTNCAQEVQSHSRYLDSPFLVRRELYRSSSSKYAHQAERRSRKTLDSSSLFSPYDKVTSPKPPTYKSSSGRGSDIPSAGEGVTSFRQHRCTIFSMGGVSSGYGSCHVDMESDGNRKCSTSEKPEVVENYDREFDKLTKTREERVAVLLMKQKSLREELENSKATLGISSSAWTFDLHMGGASDIHSEAQVKALEKENEILQRKINACKSHVMRITCFDIKQ